MAPRTQVSRRTPSPLGEQACRLFDWLVAQDLPVNVERWEHINVLRMLVAAGLVRARIPDGRLEADGSTVQPPATVTVLTRDGFRWRKDQGQPSAYSIP